jgi:hypothetical protein
MPRTIEMGTLRLRCQRRADLENDGHIVAAEWNALISEAWGELHSMVCEQGDRYFETSTTITADGSESYPEPCAVLSTVCVERVLDNGRVVPLLRIPVQHRDKWVGRVGDARKFELIDDRLHLYPKPTTGTYRWRYIPQAPELEAFADDKKVDCVSADGLAYLLWAVCVKAKSKSESNVQLAMVERDRLAEKVKFWASERVLTQSPIRTVVDSDEDDDADYDDALAGVYGRW